MTRPAVSNLERKLGREQAARLSAIVGGTQIAIPDQLEASVFNAGRLRKRIGDGLFALLVFHFGGTRIYVPQVDTHGSKRKKRIDGKRVEQLTKRGWSTSRIARHLGCSERSIYNKRAILRSRSNGKDHA